MMDSCFAMTDELRRQAKLGGPCASLGLGARPVGAATEVGRRMCRRAAGTSRPARTSSGATGTAAALHKLQCSQPCVASPGLLGACSSADCAGAPLWQMTENGSLVAAANGAGPRTTPG